MSAPTGNGKEIRKTLDSAASDVVDALREYIVGSAGFPKIILGVVSASSAGPPATITATVFGEAVANIRYIGSTPANGSTVVLVQHGRQFISLGALA